VQTKAATKQTRPDHCPEKEMKVVRRDAAALGPKKATKFEGSVSERGTGGRQDNARGRICIMSTKIILFQKGDRSEEDDRAGGGTKQIGERDAVRTERLFSSERRRSKTNRETKNAAKMQFGHTTKTTRTGHKSLARTRGTVGGKKWSYLLLALLERRARGRGLRGPPRRKNPKSD